MCILNKAKDKHSEIAKKRSILTHEVEAAMHDGMNLMVFIASKLLIDTINKYKA